MSSLDRDAIYKRIIADQCRNLDYFREIREETRLRERELYEEKLRMDEEYEASQRAKYVPTRCSFGVFDK